MVEREKLPQGRQKTARPGHTSGVAAVVIPNHNARLRHSVAENVSARQSGSCQPRKYGSATEEQARLSAVSEEPQGVFRGTVVSNGNRSSPLSVSSGVSQQGRPERPASVRVKPQGRHQTGRRVATVRPPRKRAVLVGVNYLFAPDILLRGSSNDAAAVACALVNLCEFDPTQIVLLVDAYPSLAYRRYDRLEKNSPEDFQDGEEGQRPGDFVLWKDRQPTRRNILLALNWLRADSQPGDVLVFYFAGHGIQIDDMSGWEGEGYDEAILPMDFYGEEVNAITAVMIRNLLLSVAHDVQVTMILDCNGGQTMLDPSGTGGWTFIKGVKQRGVWPFVTDATDKVSRAVYDSSAWMHESMRKCGAQPRFVPGVDVSSTQELLDPSLQKPIFQVSTHVKGYLFASAPWSQSAIEAEMGKILLPRVDHDSLLIHEDVEKPTLTNSETSRAIYHGVFTWCFLNALRELLLAGITKPATAGKVRYGDLVERVREKVAQCKSRRGGGLLKLNQVPELTFYRSGGGNRDDLFLWPFGGARKDVSFLGYARDRAASRKSTPCFLDYLSTWEAEEQLSRASERQRASDPMFVNPLQQRFGGSAMQHKTLTVINRSAADGAFTQRAQCSMQNGAEWIASSDVVAVTSHLERRTDYMTGKPLSSQFRVPESFREQHFREGKGTFSLTGLPRESASCRTDGQMVPQHSTDQQRNLFEGRAHLEETDPVDLGVSSGQAGSLNCAYSSLQHELVGVPGIPGSCAGGSERYYCSGGRVMTLDHIVDNATHEEIARHSTWGLSRSASSQNSLPLIQESFGNRCAASFEEVPIASSVVYTPQDSVMSPYNVSPGCNSGLPAPKQPAKSTPLSFMMYSLPSSSPQAEYSEKHVHTSATTGSTQASICSYSMEQNRGPQAR